MHPDTKAKLSALALEKAQRSRTGRPVMTNDRYFTPLRNPARHSDEKVPNLQFSSGLCLILPYFPQPSKFSSINNGYRSVKPDLSRAVESGRERPRGVDDPKKHHVASFGDVMPLNSSPKSATSRPTAHS